jgi:hypothetical protein
MEAEVVVVVGDGDAAVAAIAGEEVPHRHVRQRGDGEREDERWIEAASVAAAKDAGREGRAGGQVMLDERTVQRGQGWCSTNGRCRSVEGRTKRGSLPLTFLIVVEIIGIFHIILIS